MIRTATVGTPARRTRRRIGSAVVLTAVAATAGLTVGVGTAAAKSAISVGVRSRVVTVGRTVPVTASGDSDDFGGTPEQLCLDERVGTGGWQQLRCVSGSSMQLAVRAQHRGELQFRAQLVAVVNPHRRVVDRTSDPVTVWVH